MKARDLAQPYPTVPQDSGAVDAARLLTEHGRPGLIVVDEHDHPVAILPGSQVVRLLIPRYIQDDPNLVGVVDDEFVEQMCASLEGRTVADLLPKERVPLPVVEPDAPVLEVAARMAARRSPVVAVIAGSGRTDPIIGAITIPDVLSALLPERLRDS